MTNRSPSSQPEQRSHLKVFPAVLFVTLLIAILALPSPLAFAAEPAATASPVAKKETRFPFHGKLQSVDVPGMTFTLAGKSARVFSVTAATKISKYGQPATLQDARPGDDVGGYTMKTTDGKLVALSVRFGLRAAAKKVSPAPSASAAGQ